MKTKERLLFIVFNNLQNAQRIIAKICPMVRDTKKAWFVLLSVPRVEALALPIIVEQTTSEPTPI